MTRFVELTDHAWQELCSTARFSYDGVAERLENGRWRVPLSDEAYRRVDAITLPGETHSDTILLLVAYRKAGGKSN